MMIYCLSVGAVAFVAIFADVNDDEEVVVADSEMVVFV